MNIRRPSAQDYIDADFAMSVSGDSIPPKGEFIQDLRQQWEGYFTEAERMGAGLGRPGPISFTHYLQLSRVSLLAQLKEVIPTKVREGLLSQRGANKNSDFIRKLLEYIEQELGMLSS